MHTFADPAAQMAERLSEVAPLAARAADVDDLLPQLNWDGPEAAKPAGKRRGP